MWRVGRSRDASAASLLCGCRSLIVVYHLQMPRESVVAREQLLLRAMRTLELLALAVDGILMSGEVVRP